MDDAAIAAFRDKLNGLGLEAFMQFWQQILDSTKGA